MSLSTWYLLNVVVLLLVLLPPLRPLPLYLGRLFPDRPPPLPLFELLRSVVLTERLRGLLVTAFSRLSTSYALLLRSWMY